MVECAVLGCKPDPGASFHKLPKNPIMLQKWLEFIYKHRPHMPANPEGLRICNAHFSDECFQNLMQKSLGFHKKLVLQFDAVPTIYPGTVIASGSQYAAAARRKNVGCQSDPVGTREVGLQCSLPVGSPRTVGTQLSEGTLKYRRSHGVQTKPPNTGDDATPQETPHLSLGLTEAQTNPSLPSSSLHLLVPPLQLISAAMWQVLQQQDALHYGKLKEFVSLVMDTFPDLLSESQRTELTLGLQHFGSKTDPALEVLLWEFLTRLDQLLPGPDLKQTLSWLSAAPSVVEVCMQSLSYLVDLKTLLRHHRSLGQLSPNATPSSIEGCKLSSVCRPPSQSVVGSTKMTDTSSQLESVTDSVNCSSTASSGADIKTESVMDGLHYTGVDPRSSLNGCEVKEELTEWNSNYLLTDVQTVILTNIKKEEEEAVDIQHMKIERENGARDEKEDRAHKYTQTDTLMDSDIKSGHLEQEGQVPSTVVACCPVKPELVLIRQLELGNSAIPGSGNEVSPPGGHGSLSQKGQVVSRKRKLPPSSSANGICAEASLSSPVISSRSKNTEAGLAELDGMEEDSDTESLPESGSGDSYDSAEEEAFINGEDIILDWNDPDSGGEWTSPAETKKRRCSSPSPAGTSTAIGSSSPPGSRIIASLSRPAQSPVPTPSQSTASSGSSAKARKRGRGRSCSASAVRLVVSGVTSAPAQLSGVDEEDKWRDIVDDDEEPSLPPFQPERPPGPQLASATMYSPLQLFQLFFSASVIKSIVDNTNKYAKLVAGMRKKNKWVPLTVSEFHGFLALVIHMGRVKLKTLADYWSDQCEYRLEFSRSVMTRDRFYAISWALCLCDPQEDADNMKKKGTLEYDKLFKIKPLYMDILAACRKFYHPKRELSVDERMVTSKAHCGMKRYVKDEPTKWGYKLFVLTDSSNGYTCNFFVYEGKNTAATGKGLSHDSVMALLDFSLLGRGYKVFMDHFYTSPALFLDLLKERTVACGTIRTNRQGFPKNKANDLPKKADRGAIRWYRRDGLLFVKWKDAREVSLCSTIHRAYAGDRVSRRVKSGGVWSRGSVPVPAAVKEYEQCMEGVDQSDALLGYYEVLHKAMKWYKIFFFNCIDIAVVNSFSLHKEMAQLQAQERLTQKLFRETLQAELAKLAKTSTEPEKEPEKEPEAGPSAKPHRVVMCMPAFYSVDSTSGRRVCAMCKERGKKVKTPVYCTKCDVPLCQVASRNCFKDWHDGGHHNKD